MGRCGGNEKDTSRGKPRQARAKASRFRAVGSSEQKDDAESVMCYVNVRREIK